MAGREREGPGTPACCGAAPVAPLGEQRAGELAAVLGAIADPVRLRLLSLIGAAPGGEVCVCDLTEPVGRSQPTVSHHLKVLGDAGLVCGDRRGRWVWYSLAPGAGDTLRSLGGELASVALGAAGVV